jgi:hypothetical protein
VILACDLDGVLQCVRALVHPRAPVLWLVPLPLPWGSVSCLWHGWVAAAWPLRRKVPTAACDVALTRERLTACLGKDESHVPAERVGVWGGRDIPQAPAGRAHNKHLGNGECSVQRVGVWHNSWV